MPEPTTSPPAVTLTRSREFSIERALQAFLNEGELGEAELAVQDELAARGITPKHGGLLVPDDVLAHAALIFYRSQVGNPETRRYWQERSESYARASQTGAANVIGADLLEEIFIELLRANSPFLNSGIRVMFGPFGDENIVTSKSGAPKGLRGMWMGRSALRKFVPCKSPTIAWSLVQALAYRVSRLTLYGADACVYPAGLIKTEGVNTIPVSADAPFNTMEQALNDSQRLWGGSPCFVVNPKTRAELRPMLQTIGGATGVPDQDTFAGCPVKYDLAVQGRDIWLGDFSNIYLGTWGVTEICMYGHLQVDLFRYIDIAVMRPDAFWCLTDNP